MKKDNNNKTWNERITEYVMSGQGGSGIREQLMKVEEDGAVYRRTLTKEEMDEVIKDMYKASKMYYEETRKRYAHLFGIERDEAFFKDYKDAKKEE
jgi:hypothetical protein